MDKQKDNDHDFDCQCVVLGYFGVLFFDTSMDIFSFFLI